MKSAIGKAIRFPVLAALCVLQACFTGSETGNPTKGATGVVLSLEGKPAPRARVTLIPSHFNPLDLVAQKNLLAIDTTDANGRFTFAGIDSGLYNLEATDLASGARAVRKGVRVGSGMMELPDQPLQHPGKINVDWQGASDTLTGYIYVTGSTLYHKVSSANGSVLLDSVPAGTIDSIQYGHSGPAAGPVTFSWGIKVQPDSTTAAPAPYLAWQHARTFSLNTTASGAGVTGMVTRFPLLVRLSQANFDFALARGDGSDLRFTNAAGKPWPCEIQHWDSAGKSGEAWVLVDTVFGDSLQTGRIFSGPLGAPTPLPAGSVFAVADGYAGAWHLDENPKGSAPQFSDASGRKNPGIAVGYSSADGIGTGLVEGGMTLDGKTQFAGTQQSFNNPQVFTISTWFRTTTTAGGKLIDFTDGDTVVTTQFWDRHIFMTINGTVHFSVFPPDSSTQTSPNPGIYKTIDSPTPLNDGQWHFVAARLSPAGQALFVDGKLVSSDPASSLAENITGYWRWGYGVLGGWAPPGTSRYFQGTLDEIWIAHAARSDDFLQLVYENQKPGSLFLQFP